MVRACEREIFKGFLMITWTVVRVWISYISETEKARIFKTLYWRPFMYLFSEIALFRATTGKVYCRVVFPVGLDIFEEFYV